MTDVGLAHLKRLTYLSTLMLGAPRVTEPGLANLEALPNLAKLILFRVRITDSTLLRFKGLTKLRWLVYDNGRVTMAGIDALRRSLPNVDIENLRPHGR